MADDDDDDDDPVELFQKRGKWWEGVDRNHSIGIYLYIIISNWDQTYLIQLSYILIIEFIKFWKSAHFHLSTDDHPTDPRLVAWPWRHCEPNSTPLRGPWPLHPAPQRGHHPHTCGCCDTFRPGIRLFHTFPLLHILVSPDMLYVTNKTNHHVLGM